MLVRKCSILPIYICCQCQDSISSNKLNYEGVMFGNGLLEFELNLYMMEEPVTKSIWNTEAYIAQ